MEDFVQIFGLIIGVVVVLGIVDRLLNKSDTKNVCLKISEIENKLSEVNEKIETIQKTTRN